MVQPMNYRMDVLSPVEGFLQGIRFGEGVMSERQQRDERAQMMQLGQQQEARAAQQFQAQQAAAAQQQAQAQAGQLALMDYLERLEEGTATAGELRRAIVAFPGLSDQFQQVAQSFSQERLDAELSLGKQLSFALARGNTDAAERMIRQRLEAAEAAGDERAVAVERARLIELEANPNALLMETLMPLAATMDVNEFDTFYDILGIGGDEATTAFQTLDQRARAGGLTPGTPEYQRFMLEGAPQVGLSLTVGPDGSIQVSQGPGVTGTGTGTGVSQIGGLGQGEALVEGEEGLEIVPIPGGAADQARQQALQQELGRQAQRERAGSTVIQDLQRALDLIPELGVIARGEGVLGGVTRQTQARVPGTVANRITQFTESALSNVGLDTLQQMRENSPTGGALGQVPIQQQTRLEQVLGSLKIDQPPDVLDANIKRVMNIYTDIIYGSAQERAAAVEEGRMTPEESARISGFYFDLPFDERGRSISRPGQAVVPSPEAIQLLRNDPSIERQQQFDEIFGPGSAARIMEGGR